MQHLQAVNELFSQLLALVQQTLTHADATQPLDVLLCPRLVFVAHVHDRCRLTAVNFWTEETVEVLLNLGGDPSHSALLPWPVPPTQVSFLVLGGSCRRVHIRLFRGALEELLLHSFLLKLHRVTTVLGLG